MAVSLWILHFTASGWLIARSAVIMVLVLAAASHMLTTRRVVNKRFRFWLSSISKSNRVHFNERILHQHLLLRCEIWFKGFWLAFENDLSHFLRLDNLWNSQSRVDLLVAFMFHLIVCGLPTAHLDILDLCLRVQVFKHVLLEISLLITQNEEVKSMINEIHQANESSKIKKHLSILLGDHQFIHFFIYIDYSNFSIVQGRCLGCIWRILQHKVHIVAFNGCICQLTHLLIQESNTLTCSRYNILLILGQLCQISLQLNNILPGLLQSKTHWIDLGT